MTGSRIPTDDDMRGAPIDIVGNLAACTRHFWRSPRYSTPTETRWLRGEGHGRRRRRGPTSCGCAVETSAVSSRRSFHRLDDHLPSRKRDIAEHEEYTYSGPRTPCTRDPHRGNLFVDTLVRQSHRRREGEEKERSTNKKRKHKKKPHPHPSPRTERTVVPYVPINSSRPPYRSDREPRVGRPLPARCSTSTTLDRFSIPMPRGSSTGSPCSSWVIG